MSLNIDYLEVAPLMFKLHKYNSPRLSQLSTKYEVEPPTILLPNGTSNESNQNLHLKQLSELLNALISKNKSLSTSEVSLLFDQIKRAVEIVFILQDFALGVQLLNDFALVAPFASQSKTVEDLAHNRYIEFSTYQFCLNLYNLVWFKSDSKDVERDSQKVLHNIYKKASFFRTKNEALILKDPSGREATFYNVLKIFNLTLLFKNMQFHEFYDEFLEITANESALDLVVKELPLIKSKLLVMLSIVMIFVKPFRELSLVNQADVIIDLFTMDESSFEYKLYTSLLSPLSNADYVPVVQLLSSESFVKEFEVQIDFAAPKSRSHSFVQYLSLIIDIKNAVILLSMTREVPRLKFISLLGYNVDELNEKSINDIHTNIVLLISSLSLGRVGIGYNVGADTYYNTQTSNDVDFQQNLDVFSNEIQSEGFANIVKGCLVEKYFS